MPRKKGQIGAGSRAMGGIGAKPAAPRTPMAGRPSGAPPGLGAPPPGGGGGLGGGMGGPPRMPAGPGMGPPAMGAVPRPSGGGGMGGTAGFRHGGHVGSGAVDELPGPEGRTKMEYARGGAVNFKAAKDRDEHKHNPSGEKKVPGAVAAAKYGEGKMRKAFNKGGSVSGDSKPRHKASGSFC